MNDEIILEQLNEIFKDVFDDDNIQITSETSPEDIEEWDSLAQITIVTLAEKKFNVRFELSEISGMHNVGDMISLIEQRRN